VSYLLFRTTVKNIWFESLEMKRSQPFNQALQPRVDLHVADPRQAWAFCDQQKVTKALLLRWNALIGTVADIIPQTTVWKRCIRASSS
jgi:hypothetical protein